MTERRDFDKAAATWDEEPRRVALARDVAAAIVDEVHPSRDMDALDFGCGTGLLTLALQPHVRSITGVDSSRGMLQVLEAKVREQGLENVRSVLCDFESGQRPQGAWHLIVSCMTLHHIPEPAELFVLLYDLLAPGGTICLADLDREDGSFHDEPTGVFHSGFERPDITKLLRRQGFSTVRDRTAAEIRKGSATYPVFLITATKPQGA